MPFFVMYAISYWQKVIPKLSGAYVYKIVDMSGGA